MSATMSVSSFAQLKLSKPLILALSELGFETPTPIQAASIPALLKGQDVLAQAQTGTGKTAAFALPTLEKIDLTLNVPQALILTPTRELAIQVASAFESYAKHMKGLRVAPIYGGQAYSVQLRALKQGTHVIVGTPGRVMDHLRRGSLSIAALKMMILDEADEMLKMGFIDDIEWILEQIPQKHQTALFSATLPGAVQKISKRYLSDANTQHIHLKATIQTANKIEQCYIIVDIKQKLEVLTRLLDIEPIQAALIFVRTKSASAELAEKLQVLGHKVAALNGDMNQSMRETVLSRIKRGALNLIVATDVAARGIDVDRISHVINYDSPHDLEAYTHRIGRTGRAGRAGKAILLLGPRERRLLQDIERATLKPLIHIMPPSREAIAAKRAEQLAEKITGVLKKSKQLVSYYGMVDEILKNHTCKPTDIAAALLYLAQQDNPLPTDDIVSPRAERYSEKPEGRSYGRQNKYSDSRPSGDRAGRSSGDRASGSSDDRPSRKFGDNNKSGPRRSDAKPDWGKTKKFQEDSSKSSGDARKPYAAKQFESPRKPSGFKPGPQSKPGSFSKAKPRSKPESKSDDGAFKAPRKPSTFSKSGESSTFKAPRKPGTLKKVGSSSDASDVSRKKPPAKKHD